MAFCACEETTARSWKRRTSICTRKANARRRWQIVCARKLNGCGAGPKRARRKAKARIDKAHEMIGELADLNARTRSASAKIDFSATDRQTKRLIELEGVGYGSGGRTLFKKLNFTLTAGMRVGIGRAERQRQNNAVAIAARRTASRLPARFNAPSRCAWCTSTRAASWIPI